MEDKNTEENPDSKIESNQNIEPSRRRRTDAEVEETLDEILRYMIAGVNERQMMQALNMPRSTFNWYRQKLYDRQAKVQLDKTFEVMFHENQVLKERLIRIYTKLEGKLLKDEIESRDVGNVAEKLKDIAVLILRTESEGIKAGAEVKRALKQEMEDNTEQVREEGHPERDYESELTRVRNFEGVEELPSEVPDKAYDGRSRQDKENRIF